ncbi:MAG TPA: fumarate reductase/succinate dehydrogenase flavoprotein subunit, partial [Tepidisphaeraceae bacterium]|nr:fumarate reductase/succinate dehydrogenase flavoprotein subunit [Tepidisphaeraceae bacterium]
MEATTVTFDVEVLVIGGGSAGTVAAIKAKEAMPTKTVLLLEKANIRRSGAITMGMDGLNNAVLPGHATPEQYVKEITMANDGIVNQRSVLEYGRRSADMVKELDAWGVKFQKDENGEFDVKKVHHKGAYVLPMPEGYDLKKLLCRKVRRVGVKVENRIMATRLLTDNGRIAGAMGFNTRTGAFVVIRAKAVILCCGAAGRLGLPASGYLYGTYEMPTNAGDGYSMAYHAGAELTNIECFQVNPLMKDYNGPACAYVAGPFGGHTVNAKGNRFIECDYWSGQMMMEFYKELEGGSGPVYLKMNHLADETITEIERIMHGTERPTRGLFHEGRGHNYRTHMVEMHISEIGLCSGHSASGVWIDEHGRTTVPGLYAAGDMGSVPHSYLLGAFTYGWVCAEDASAYVKACGEPLVHADQVEAERDRVTRPLRTGVADGLPHHQVEYKLRRMVNDYLQPPKVTTKMNIGLEHFMRMRADLDGMGCDNPHDLMRTMEVHFIRDCAEMAARASLERTESRWGLYHYRVD